jgi:XTP/dITP diphosphohydrolase
MEIVIASHNVHKIRELRELLKEFTKLEVLTLHNFSSYQPPESSDSTFQENAILKATHAAKALNVWAIADDSGLVVPVLNGFTKRYTGLESRDRENRIKLLHELKGKSEIERAAFYECCLALASPNGLEKVVTGICEGQIAHEERGRNGFGFDSLFIKHDYEKTFAEFDDTYKNRISHRRKAFEKMVMFLDSKNTKRRHHALSH